MKSILRRFIVFAVFLFCTTTVFAAISYPLFQTSSRILEDAIYAFDTGEYGTAFRLAEEAKLQRRQEVSDCLNLFTQAMKPLAVQNAGDSVTDVLAILKEREVYDAVALIEYLLEFKGADYFENSLKNIVSYLEMRNKFPETSYLIAKIYETEGEYDLANTYYLESWQDSHVLDISEMRYNILYDMANLSYNFFRQDECEKALLLIIADDSYFSDSAYKYSVCKSVEKGYNADKVFELYRTDCFRSVPAYFRLTELFFEQGRWSEAFETALFGVLTAFTRMNQILQERLTEYNYNSFNYILEQAMQFDDIIDWSIKNNFWQGLYRLAILTEKLYPENAEFKQNILFTISTVAPENYWKQLAIKEIK